MASKDGCDSVYDSSDNDNYLDIFPEPKSKVASENIEQNLDVGESRNEGMSFSSNTADSEIGSAEAANISDFKIISSTKTYTRKKEPVMFSKQKNKISDQQHSTGKHVEFKIHKNKLLFPNVSNSDKVKKPKLTCESNEEDNSTGCTEFQERDISPVIPQKKLKGAYARTRKNLVQKIKSNNGSNLNKSTRCRNVISSAKIKTPINTLPNSHSDLTSYSKEVSDTFSLDSLIDPPIQPSNLHVNAINNQTCLHEQKTSTNGMSLMDMLKKYSLKTNNNLFNDVPVPKSPNKKCDSEKSQTKKISEKKAVISTKSHGNSDSFLETEFTTEKVATGINKNSKESCKNLAIKSMKQLKPKICSNIPYNKNVKIPTKEPTHFVQIKSSSSLDRNLANISALNSSQENKFVAASLGNTSVINKNCFENKTADHQNNFVNLNSNPGVKFIAASSANMPVENHMTEMLTPMVLNSGTVFNTIPQVTTTQVNTMPLILQPNSLTPSTVPPYRPYSQSVIVMPCCKCSVPSNLSQAAYLGNNCAPPPVAHFTLHYNNNNPPTLYAINNDVHNLMHQPAVQNLLGLNTHQNNLSNLNNEQNRDPVVNLPNSVNETNVSNNLPSQCRLETTIINKKQTSIDTVKVSSSGVQNSSITDQQTHNSLKPDFDSDMSEDDCEEDAIGSTNADQMAAFISHNESLIKAIHKQSFEELRNNLSKRNSNHIKFKTVNSFYSAPQVQEVLDSFCSPYVRNFPIKYKLPDNFKSIDYRSLLKDYIKFHILHIVQAHPQKPFCESRFSVLEKGKSRLNFLEKDLFKIMCTKHQNLDLKNLIEILSFVGMIILYTEYVKKNGS